MRQELLASQKSGRGILLDPRTKLALLITISVFVLSGGIGVIKKPQTATTKKLGSPDRYGSDSICSR